MDRGMVTLDLSASGFDCLADFLPGNGAGAEGKPAADSVWERYGVYREFKNCMLEGRRKLDAGEPFTGWVSLPWDYSREELNKIRETAAEIQKKCDAFVLIGVGGSYIGARAGIEALNDFFGPVGRNGYSERDTPVPRIYYAGYNLSGTYHSELLAELENKEVCICVISKSGTTTEPCVAFALLKEMLIQRYGIEEARKRIYVVTDAEEGILREEVRREGYTSFEVPRNIGGRYSVLTAVGLLPMAVAGVDVGQILEGAAHMAERENGGLGQAAQLALSRFLLNRGGKYIEIFETYEPRLYYFIEWLKQLFGESEGKKRKGIFPVGLQLTMELHSIGQFLQEGSPIFFETVLDVRHSEKDLVVPESAGEFLAGKKLSELNRAAAVGVRKAHQKDGIPMIRLDIPALTPYHFGQMVYFFETTCALSCYLLGVNPFDQPGVEQYKLEMRKALAK